MAEQAENPVLGTLWSQTLDSRWDMTGLRSFFSAITQPRNSQVMLCK